MRKKVFIILSALLFICPSISYSQLKTIVSGTLLGFDSKPLAMSHVHVKYREDSADVASFLVNKDGAFKIELNERRVYFLSFTGVNHSKLIIPFVNDKTQKAIINVKLKTSSYDENFYVVQVIGDFNDFNFTNSKKMERDTIKNIFSISFDWDKPKFRYQLLNLVPNRSVNGTQSENFEYDNDGDYRSVVSSQNGKVNITFDPNKLIRSNKNEYVMFKEKNSLNGKIYSLLMEELKWYTEYSKQYNEHLQFGVSPKGFKFNWDKFIHYLKKELTSDKSSIYRKVLLQSYVSLIQFGVNKLDTAFAIELLRTTEPSSFIWDIKPVSVIAVTKFLNKEIANFYLDKFYDENKNKFIKLEILYTKFIEANANKNDLAAKSIYNQIITEYIELPFAQFIKENYMIEERIKTGNDVPDFSVKSIDDSAFTISKTRMLGKIYLIDFWAAWCKPCVDDMNNLHSAYGKYKEKGFEIISFSFDTKIDDVQKFRQEKWKMPWLNSFVEKQFNSELANIFGVKEIPKQLLVDKNGKVIGMNEELRGDNLEKKLNEIFK